MSKLRRTKKARIDITDDVLRAFQLERAGRPAEAERLYLDVIQGNPRNPIALHQLGLMHRERGEFSKALELVAAALKADRTSAEIVANYGLILHDLGRYEEAIESFNRTLVIDRVNVAAIYNRGRSLAALNRLREALASYDRAASLDPGHAEAKFQAALARLCLGDFHQGWKDYEWRWREPARAAARRDFTMPLWLGDVPPAEKTILLHAEQGLGDTIQFVRYVPLVAALGARIILEVDQVLKPLMADVRGVDYIVARGERAPQNFDLHSPLPSLPLAFGTDLASIPCQVPYLYANAERAAAWSSRLERRTKLRAGLVWAGNPALRNDRNRSIALGRLAPLWSVPDVEAVSLQRALRAGDERILAATPQILHIGDALNDFADAAAAISVLDLVIAVDTSVAHLAGALGKPVFVLLPFAPDFRWMLDRRDSPWYPTARLFRQPRIDDWESVVAQVREELVRMTRPGS